MRSRQCAWLAALCCAVRVFAQDIQVAGLDPTVLFANKEPLRQIAILHLDNRSHQAVRCRIAVRAGDVTTEDVLADVAPGVTTHRVLIPDLTAPGEVRIEVRREQGGDVLASEQRKWQPQRKWKVWVVKSAHEDLGYENFIFNKQHDIANYIDMARTISRAPVANGVDSGYHYTMETLLFQRNYIEERSETAWRDIVEKDIKTGRMHLMGAPSGVHSHWMDYEEIARMTYPGRREARDRFGLDLATFMIVDNPSLSWSGCQAVAGAGFRYVARWGQGWRTGGNNDYQTTKLPALFWWQAPDGKHRVLFGWRHHYGLSFWYGQPGDGYENLVDFGAEHVNRELQLVESGARLGPYPYDALVTPEYTDHDIPHFDGRALAAWGQHYRYPEIHIGSPTQFFAYIEAKYGKELPVLSGDLNNFSADYATIDPESQGWKRRAARMLPLAEGLAAVAGLLDAGFAAPARLIERTFQRLFDYDEHSWPTLPKASDVHLFNAQWVKKNEAARALEGAQEALESSFSALTRHVPTGDGVSILVFNPLAHTRTDLASVAGRFAALEDLATGKRVATQISGGRTIFVAADVPAFGYKVFRLTTVAESGAGGLSVTPDGMENRFYRIRFDRKTGSIASILDKELGRDLVDPTAARQFNQLVYVHTASREEKELETYSPPAARSMAGSAGTQQAEFAVHIDDPKTGAAITQTAILYRDLKRIDLINDLRHVRALYSDRYEDRYDDNIFYAFPLKVENGTARAEYAGGVVRPYDDQLRWGSHDYLSANRWVDTSNSSFGVTVAPWNVPVFHFGEIRYNRFAIDYKPASPHLYAYGYSNRMAGLLTLNADECNATLRYSITSHAGDWAANATRFGWSVASPLETRILPAGQRGSLDRARASFVSVDAANVQLVTLKQSEQPGRGWIVRLVETAGRSTEVKLSLPAFAIRGAMECNLVGDDVRPLTMDDGTIPVAMGPYSFSTIRVFSGDAAPPAVTGVRAEAISDKSIHLSWSPAGAAAAYNIYRSDDPAEPPTAYTLAGRSTRPEFSDDWLHLGTKYYYFVAASGRSNNQGPVSAQVAASTLRRNTSPPAPVRDLGVVRRAKDRLILYWRKSPEPDVARYLVYRGERADFQIKGSEPVAVVAHEPYFLEIYQDRNLTPGKTYYYRVVAEDWAGNRQNESPLAQAATPAYQETAE